MNDFSEKANLAVTLVTSDEEVVASGAFFDYPNLAVDQAKWEKLFQETFQSIKPTVSVQRVCSFYYFRHYTVFQSSHSRKHIYTSPMEEINWKLTPLPPFKYTYYYQKKISPPPFPDDTNFLLWLSVDLF
jgi:hypothetical protein